jgi:hypothetical protein
MRDSMSRTVERFPPPYLLDEHLGDCDPLFRKMVRIREFVMYERVGDMSGIQKVARVLERELRGQPRQ